LHVKQIFKVKKSLFSDTFTKRSSEELEAGNDQQAKKNSSDPSEEL
jgi:hypothetical protein